MVLFNFEEKIANQNREKKLKSKIFQLIVLYHP